MKKLLTLLFICLALPAFSQINFEPGYFINEQGNKTECLIKNLAWKNNPTAFEYKATADAEVNSAGIATVKEFGVSGYKFERYEVDIDRSTNDISRMDGNKEPVYKKETLYLKVLVMGKATLYQYEDGNLVRYFISGGDNNIAPTQLVFKEYVTDGKIAANNFFRAQLFNALKSNTNGASDFKQLVYKKQELISVFLKYNNIGEDDIQNLSKSQNRAEFKLKVTAGAAVNSLSVYSNNESLHKFDSGLTYSVGTEFEVVLPFNNKKWSLFANPQYFTYSDTSTEIFNITSVPEKNWKIDYKGIDIPLGVRHYMFLNDKSKLFIDAAYVVTMAVGESQLSYRYNTANALTSEMKISKSANFCVSAGFCYERYSASVRYGSTRQLLGNYLVMGADYATVGIILSYSLL